MRIRPLLLLAPAIVAWTSLIGAPMAARATGGAAAASSATASARSGASPSRSAAPTYTPLAVAGQAFVLKAWPGDSAWAAAVRGDLSGDVQKLENLTGLPMPGGTVIIAEVGDGLLDDNGVSYNPSTRTLTIPRSAAAKVVAHALSHIWFDPSLLKDRWMSEGLAGFSEQAAGAGKYTPCTRASAYPGIGLPNLSSWRTLNYYSTIQDQNVYHWQFAVSCAFFTAVAKAVGPENFKAVLEAAAADDIAYAGTDPNEKAAGARLPLTARRLLDLIDERGMVPAGVSDLDEAQKLLAGYGIFDSATLAARSTARAAYHALVSRAGDWQLPLAIRGPMSGWNFPSAQAAMTTAGHILDLCDLLREEHPGFSLATTGVQAEFESAATQSDLDSLFTQIESLASATDTPSASGTQAPSVTHQASPSIPPGGEAATGTSDIAAFVLLAIAVLIVVVIVLIQLRRARRRGTMRVVKRPNSRKGQ